MKHLIVPIRATKRTETDSYNHGCNPDTCQERGLDLPAPAESILEVMSELVGAKLGPADCYTFDPNIYCDVKGGGARVVADHTREGRFRVEHDRCENRHGRKPTKAELADFTAGKLNLKHATYELHFHIRMAQADEYELATFLGIDNGDHTGAPATAAA